MAAPTCPAPPTAVAAPGWEAFHHVDVAQLPSLTLGFDTTPCPQRQRGGRSEGRALWLSFITQRGRRYRGSLSKPLLAWEFGSRLSPHLAWGTLSMREVVQSLRRQRQKHADDTAWARSLRAFTSRLYWHCHFIQKLESEPSIEHQTLHPALRGLRERDPGHPHLIAWKRGQTGVPLVDACMRSLTATGWINFRMRAMLLSHATFGLGLHWYEPALHLARLFTDFEPGIHYPQVQMQAGATGTNAMRVYNPIKQAEDNDPTGEFIARWVPELAPLPMEWRAKPWALPESLQKRFGFQPGVDYPIPNDFEAEARYWTNRLAGQFSYVTGSVSHQHIYGFLFRFLLPILSGTRAANDLALSWDGLFAGAPGDTLLVSSPAHLTRIAPDDVIGDYSASVILSSGGPLPLEAALEVHRIFGQPPIEILGSTEERLGPKADSECFS